VKPEEQELFVLKKKYFYLTNGREVIQTNNMKSIRPILLIGLVIITFFSCHKSTFSPTYAGDWARESPMVMASRSEAVSFVL
jgi:hypothetical protein